MPNGRFVSVGLLTQRDLDVLGSGFRRAFPLNSTTDFTSLLIEIDRACEEQKEVTAPKGPWLLR
jgi:hypothetical protein